jgi:hypothetical protein
MRLSTGQALQYMKDNGFSTSTKSSDRKYVNLNDLSFIDKMIGKTTDSNVIAQLEKQKRNCVFYL